MVDTNLPPSPLCTCPCYVQTPCDVIEGTPCSPNDLERCFCAGLTCGEDINDPGNFICGDGEDPGTPTTTSPISSPPTNRPTSFPTTSKSSKQSKSAKAKTSKNQKVF